jgi:hypothetical protein
MNEPIEIKSGERFIIGTKSYSDTNLDTVTALKDILTADFERMHKEIESYVESNENRYKSGYELITAWLVHNGYVTLPDYPKELHFHYESDIKEAFIHNNEYQKKDFDEASEIIRSINP